MIARPGAGDPQAALRELHGQEEQCRETQQHEQSGADLESSIRLHDGPRTSAPGRPMGQAYFKNIAVRIKSRSNVSTDDATTVRVVASPTPAAVGAAW